MTPNGIFAVPSNKSSLNDMRASHHEEQNENLRLVEAVVVGGAFIIALGAIALYLKSKEKQ